jgi:hypothetical protein
MIAKNNGLEYISFDKQSILQSARHDPIGFIDGLHHKKVVLDEFKYVPELIPAILINFSRIIYG